MFFVLSRAWDKEKNSESLWGIEPQTFRFRAPMLHHWTTDFIVTIVIMVTFMNVFFTPEICFQLGMRRGHSFISLQKFYRKGYEDLPPEELLVGVVVPLLVGSTSVLLPFIELTLNSPSFPSFTASLSVMITSCSLVVELNFSARSTKILPHLGTDIN